MWSTAFRLENIGNDKGMNMSTEVVGHHFICSFHYISSFGCYAFIFYCFWFSIWVLLHWCLLFAIWAVVTLKIRLVLWFMLCTMYNCMLFTLCNQIMFISFSFFNGSLIKVKIWHFNQDYERIMFHKIGQQHHFQIHSPLRG